LCAIRDHDEMVESRQQVEGVEPFGPIEEDSVPNEQIFVNLMCVNLDVKDNVDNSNSEKRTIDAEINQISS
jgi:hypothetical protein